MKVQIQIIKQVEKNQETRYAFNSVYYCYTNLGISLYFQGFPNSSVGKESACNAGDLGLIPGSGRSTGEGIGSLQYSWACLVTHLVKNPPAMQETWVRSLSWEDPLEKGKATYSSILACRIPWILQSMGSQKQYMLLIQSIIVIKIWVYHFIFIDSI